MINAPDYRSDPSESPEGRGIAYGRLAAFWKSLPESVQAEASREATISSIEEYPALIRDQVTSTAVEDAELIGFWVAWHKAGGFGGLESGGWHRATVYRKIRRFRARFGAHPDEYRFEWIKLDLRRAWTEDLEDALFFPSTRTRTPAERTHMPPPPHSSGQTVANMHLSSDDNTGVRELASGIDALYLSGYGYLSKGFLAQLEEERLFADRVSVLVPFELGPVTLGLAPHGWGKYRYCLDHETGRIGFTSSRRLPTVRIQPRAEFLHSVGPKETVRHFDDLVRPFIEGLVLSVARLDLFVDMEGMQLCAQDRSAFVCRGDGCTTYENGNVVTGFAFGSRRNQRITARLYDKTAEMSAKGTDWWELVWGERHTPGVQVWRIEFEIGRAALSDLELFHPDAVLAAAPSLWAYCAGEWLTLRNPTADSNRSRWPVDGRWQAVQSASLAHGATELRFIRERKRAAVLRHIVPVLVGYLVAFAEAMGTTNIDDTFGELLDAVANDEIARHMTFAERVRRRRAERGYR